MAEAKVLTRTGSVVTCPLCGERMKRPTEGSGFAKEEFLECPNCGLEAYQRTLITDEGRTRVELEYRRKLEEKVAEGEKAQQILEKIKAPIPA